MPATLQNTKVSCRGGLDLRSTSQELLGKPGFAQQLDNFESGHRGGYLRINGYSSYGTNPVPGTGTIKGIRIFNESILVAKGDALYHTFDTLTWVQVNRVASGNFATFTATAATDLNSSATDVEILPYSHGVSSEEQIVTIVNGQDNVMVFKVSGTDHTNANYSFEFLDPGTSAAPAGAKFGFVFEDQVYLSGVEATPSSVFVSTLTDPTTYNGTQSGEFAVADPIVGMHPFRDQMILFCENKIVSLKDANNTSTVLTPITTDLGCLDGNSIQEVGGDLVFWSKDGLRTVAGTDRIDDVELSSISSDIQPFFEDLQRRRDLFKVSSVVLREKNQYRIYFPYTNVNTPNSLGVIGTLIQSANGLGWSWSVTKDMRVNKVTEGEFGGKTISLMSSGDDGLLYQHDKGDTFNGTNIRAIFRTPFADMGDPSVRKNFHRIRTYIKPEGQADVDMSLKFTGYNNETPSSPSTYNLGELRTPAIYGQAEYGSNYTYGARVIDNTVTNTEGSGFTYSLTYYSDGADAQYNIQGYDVDFIVSGKV